jgi:uncharacterized membrane protein
MSVAVAPEAGHEPAGPVFLDAVLKPHRSLPPRGFHILMAIMAAVSFIVGIAFVVHGAWPVTGFFGLDVAALFLAFRLSYRSARQRERIRLGAEALTVERVDVYGASRHWRFQPYWLRVIFEERPDDTNRLLVASHGRSLALGTFLSAPERRDFAGILKEALGRWRASFSPAP